MGDEGEQEGAALMLTGLVTGDGKPFAVGRGVPPTGFVPAMHPRLFCRPEDVEGIDAQVSDQEARDAQFRAQFRLEWRKLFSIYKHRVHQSQR